MNLSAPFIKRPIATILLTIGLALSGIAGFLVLPVAPLPNVDLPVINVSASLPGASPQTMAQDVATPLERRLGTIAMSSRWKPRCAVLPMPISTTSRIVYALPERVSETW